MCSRKINFAIYLLPNVPFHQEVALMYTYPTWDKSPHLCKFIFISFQHYSLSIIIRQVIKLFSVKYFYKFLSLIWSTMIKIFLHEIQCEWELQLYPLTTNRAYSLTKNFKSCQWDKFSTETQCIGSQPTRTVGHNPRLPKWHNSFLRQN